MCSGQLEYEDGERCDGGVSLSRTQVRIGRCGDVKKLVQSHGTESF